VSQIFGVGGVSMGLRKTQEGEEQRGKRWIGLCLRGSGCAPVQPSSVPHHPSLACLPLKSCSTSPCTSSLAVPCGCGCCRHEVLAAGRGVRGFGARHWGQMRGAGALE